MNVTLSDVVHRLNLQPGQIHREVIDGFLTELRILNDEPPTPELAQQIMLDHWPSYPRSKGGVAINATLGRVTLPDPPVIPVDEVED